MWNGSTAPTNWRLCNGTNGTPDLSDKFVLGYGPKAIGTVGGAATVTLSLAEIPAHSHTAQDVGHSHPVSAPTGQSEAGGGSQDTARPSTGTNTSQGYANIQIGQSGQSGAHNNMPPYYVLAFIMRYQ
jgi:microcystin-dependent protein